MLDEIRGPANMIGAVNTIVMEEDENIVTTDPLKRKRVGYNTDWLGIKRPIVKLLRLHGRSVAGKKGIVIGAGMLNFYFSSYDSSFNRVNKT